MIISIICFFIDFIKDLNLIFNSYLGIGFLIPLEFYYTFSLTLFFISILGILLNKQKNMLVVMLFFELMLFSLSFLSIIFSLSLSCIQGQLLALLILSIAVSESTIGLSFLIALFYENQRIDFHSFAYLRG